MKFFRSIRSQLLWVFAFGVLLAVGACRPTEQSLGSIHGRVLGPGGNPVRGARVSLDGPNGTTALSDVNGAFHLTAAHGGHDLYALHVSTHAAALVNVEVDGSSDVGEIFLTDCDDVPTPDGGEGTPGGTPDGGDGTDPAPPPPCDWEEPPPPDGDVHIDELVADYTDGFVDTYGLFFFGDSVDQQIGLDGWIAGDFSEGGSRTVSIENAQPWNDDAHIGAFTYSDYGYYYVIHSGEVTVDVADTNGDGNLNFHVVATDLELHYMGWDGTIDSNYKLTIGSADLEGEAWTYQEPEPPTEDVTIDPFVADWVDILLLEGCAPDGSDLLFVYAWDESANADLNLGISVNDLTLPGSADLTGWIAGGTTDGVASYYGSEDGSGWFYDLNHITVATDATAIAVDDELTLSLTDGQFDYWGGVVIVEPTDPPPGDPTNPDGSGSGSTGSGGGTTDPPEAEFHLYIDNGEVTGTVVDGYGEGPVPMEG